MLDDAAAWRGHEFACPAAHELHRRRLLRLDALLAAAAAARSQRRDAALLAVEAAGLELLFDLLEAQLVRLGNELPEVEVRKEADGATGARKSVPGEAHAPRGTHNATKDHLQRATMRAPGSQIQRHGLTHDTHPTRFCWSRPSWSPMATGYTSATT